MLLGICPENELVSPWVIEHRVGADTPNNEYPGASNKKSQLLLSKHDKLTSQNLNDNAMLIDDEKYGAPVQCHSIPMVVPLPKVVL